MSQMVSQAASPTQSHGASTASGPVPQRGGYARSDVELTALYQLEQARELSLALPFGALFSALLQQRSYRIRELQLDYVDAERLAERATYSAQIGEALEQGQALELRLLISRGPWLCVRGRAVLELGSALQGSSHG